MGKIEEKLLQQDQHISQLQANIDALEQQARSNNIEITNLPERHSENLVQLFIKIGQLIEIPITANDLISINRVPQAKKNNNQPKNVIVKVTSRILRDNILAAARRVRNQAKLKSDQLGITGTNNIVYLNEHLTFKNKLIYREARLAAKEFGFRFVWPKHGTILVRANETSAIFAVRSVEEVKQKIKKPVSG